VVRNFIIDNRNPLTNKQEGRGIWVHKNGDLYEGWFKDGQFNGHARYIWGDGG
jgi:hypothetical protein